MWQRLFGFVPRDFVSFLPTGSLWLGTRTFSVVHQFTCGSQLNGLPHFALSADEFDDPVETSRWFLFDGAKTPKNFAESGKVCSYVNGSCSNKT